MGEGELGEGEGEEGQQDEDGVEGDHGDCMLAPGRPGTGGRSRLRGRCRMADIQRYSHLEMSVVRKEDKGEKERDGGAENEPISCYMADMDLSSNPAFPATRQGEISVSDSIKCPGDHPRHCHPGVWVIGSAT